MNKENPSICVVDTCLIIDLYIGKVLAEFFKLPYRFVTPDVIIAELQEPESSILIKLGLHQYELTGNQVLEVMQLKTVYRNPSVNDLFALVLAKVLDSILLTGDGHLRKAAQQEGVSVHGTLWVLDEMVRLQTLSRMNAIDALQHMLHRGSRLPQEECDKRFQAWRNE